MKLVARKFFIPVDLDEFLQEAFGATRERSRAVAMALQDFKRKVETNREKAEVTRIDLGKIR
jgi:hypothetical protein